MRRERERVRRDSGRIMYTGRHKYKGGKTESMSDMKWAR